MIKIFIKILFSLVVCSSFAQNFKNDMMTMNKKLKATDKFSVKLHYSMFLDNNMEKPYQERDIEIKKEKHRATVKQKEIEYIAGDNVIMVDHKFKKIHLLAKNDASGKSDQYLEVVNFIEKNFDSIAFIYDKVTYKEVSKNIGMYECAMKVGQYYKMQIFFDLTTKLPKGVVYFNVNQIRNKKIDDKPHSVVIRIDYLNLNLNPTFSIETFSTDKYFTALAKNRYSPSSTYSNYEIINQLAENYESQK